MGNIELYWDIVNDTITIIYIAIEGLLFCRFVKPFMKENTSAYRVWFPYFAVMAALYYIPLPGRYAYIAGITVFILLMYLLDRRNAEQKIFLAFTMFLLQWVTTIALVFRRFMFDTVILIPYMTRRVWLQLGVYAIVECLYYLLRILILYELIRIIHKVYIYKKENISVKELILLLIPYCSVFIGKNVFTFLSDIYEEDLGKYVWNAHEGYESLLFLYQLIALSVMLVVIAVYQSIKMSQQKEKESIVLEEQIDNIKRHIREVEKLYEDIRSLKHDMGNHVMVLESLFMKDERQELEQYLLQLKENLKETVSVIRSGNPVTDVILTEKQRLAEEKGITFLCEFYFPDEINIDVFDVSIILNNALENAVRASENGEKPYVHILSYSRKNAFIIEIKNGFTGILSWDEESGLPETTKEDSKNHGYGLGNIKRVAQKYHGDIEIAHENEEFRLSVLLMTESS